MLTRMVSLQMAPQIRMVQASDITMSEKIQSTLVNTIPLWKSQMIIALGVEHSREAADAQRKVTDLTNDLLKKNAEKLKTATIETAKESERLFHFCCRSVRKCHNKKPIGLYRIFLIHNKFRHTAYKNSCLTRTSSSRYHDIFIP